MNVYVFLLPYSVLLLLFIYSFSLLFLLCTLGLFLLFGRPTAHERSLKIVNVLNFPLCLIERSADERHCPLYPLISLIRYWPYGR